jgi:acetyl esterase/lipase
VTRARVRWSGWAAPLMLACCGTTPAASGAEVVRLWPGQAPGTESWTGPEQQADATLPNVGKVHVITDVTVPTLTVVKPAAGKANGTAMVVVPGGAFRALPWDLDGLETARWLAAHGITAFVLKYRVRPPPPEAPVDRSFDDFARRTEPARAIAVADAEQALRLVRSRARRYSIDPHRVGMIGFSAGAMTTMDVALAANPSDRPDFAASLYGAVLTKAPAAKDAPPIFIAAAQDDTELSPEKSLQIFRTWTDAGADAELHVYDKGGHSFGFRVHHTTADRWPEAFQAWLAAHRFLVQRGAGSR